MMTDLNQKAMENRGAVSRRDFFNILIFGILRIFSKFAELWLMWLMHFPDRILACERNERVSGP